jgi:putative transcriptional regulator
VARLEAVGGTVLADIAPTPLAPDAFARVLQRIELGDGQPAEPAPVRDRHVVDGIRLPKSLDRCTIGAWRWLGPGIQISRIAVPHAPQANVILLKAVAGRHMPAHGHSEFEITQVLHGWFSDGGDRFGAGDIAEGDDEALHRPVVGQDSACISLAAIEGKLLLRGALGRLLQPFVRL